MRKGAQAGAACTLRFSDGGSGRAEWCVGMPCACRRSCPDQSASGCRRGDLDFGRDDDGQVAEARDTGQKYDARRGETARTQVRALCMRPNQLPVGDTDGPTTRAEYASPIRLSETVTQNEKSSLGRRDCAGITPFRSLARYEVPSVVLGQPT